MGISLAGIRIEFTAAYRRVLYVAIDPETAQLIKMSLNSPLKANSNQ